MLKCDDDFLKRIKFSNVESKKEPEKDEEKHRFAMDDVSFYGENIPARPIKRIALGARSPSCPEDAVKREAGPRSSARMKKSPKKVEPIPPRPDRPVRSSRNAAVKYDSPGSSDDTEDDESDEEPRKRRKKMIKKREVVDEPEEEQKEEEEMKEGSIGHLRREAEKAKREMFKKLGLDKDLQDLDPAQKPKPKPKPKVQVKVVKKEPPETRQSLNLQQKVEPADSPKKKVLSPVKFSFGSAQQNVEQADSPKKKVLSPVKFSFGSTQKAVRNLEPVKLYQSNHFDALGFLEKIRMEEAFLTDKGEFPGVESSDLTRFVKRMKKLTLAKSQVGKITSARVTTMSVHPSEEPMLVAAGDGGGVVGLMKIDKERSFYAYSVHKAEVSSLCFNPWRPRQLVTTGHDAVVRSLDLEKDVFEVLHADPEDKEINTDMEFKDANCVLVSRGDGKVQLIDFRMQKEKVANSFKCHDESVQCLSVHPHESHYFATGSRYGNGSFVDIRGSAPRRLSSFCAFKSVSSVAFSRGSGTRLSVVSCADTVTVFDTKDALKSNGGSRVIPFAKWRHNNQTASWVTGFKAAWHPRRDDCFLLGSREHPRKIELFSDDGKLLHEFEDDEVNLVSICSILSFHPSRDVVFGADFNGKMHYFVQTIPLYSFATD